MPVTKRRSPQVRTILRRQQIIQAALACFSEFGHAETTMEDIRRRSRASNGSIYHQFRSKEDLAAAVYLEGLKLYQAGFVMELNRHEDARDGVMAMVHYHLGWVREHPAWARYLFQMRRASFMASTEQRIVALNRGFQDKVGAWFRPHIKRAVIKRLTPDLYAALLLGPCQSYARQWLSGQTQTDPDSAALVLADAAWQVLRFPDREKPSSPGLP